MGFVFQSFNLLARTTVLDNVKLPLVYSKLKNLDSLAEIALESVGLSHRLNYFTNQISGGEKQRVAIARALVNNPAVIFADEPTGNLDRKTGERIIALLREAAGQEKRTVVVVTHDEKIAKEADRRLEIEDGVLREIA